CLQGRLGHRRGVPGPSRAVGLRAGCLRPRPAHHPDRRLDPLDADRPGRAGCEPGEALMRRLLFGLGLLLGLGVLLARFGGGPLVQVVGRLAFGWWSYLARVGPRVTVSRDGMITGLACLLLFTIGLHRFLRWVHGEILRANGLGGRGSRRWRRRWTA